MDDERRWTLATAALSSFVLGYVGMSLLGPADPIIPPHVNGLVAASCATFAALLSWRGGGRSDTTR